jgi:hypothetical protein
MTMDWCLGELFISRLSPLRAAGRTGVSCRAFKLRFIGDFDSGRYLEGLKPGAAMVAHAPAHNGRLFRLRKVQPRD